MSKAASTTSGYGKAQRRGWNRFRKRMYQKFWGGRAAGETPVVVFLVGDTHVADDQIMPLLEKSLETEVYRAGDTAAFEDGRLRPDETLRNLIGRSRAPVMIFALAETPSAEALHALIERFQPARAVWLYKDHRAFVAEARRQYSRNQARERLDRLDPRSPEADEQAVLPPEWVAMAADESLDESAGWALLWYDTHLRFQAQGLDRHRQIRLFSGESLQQTPEESLSRLLESMGVGADVLYKTRVKTARRNARAELIDLPDNLATACESLQSWLDQKAIR